MTVKLRLAVAALLLFLVVMVDFTSRIMSVLADGVLVCGIVVLRCWKGLPVFWVFVWRITCDGKTAPGCGCTPAVSGGDGGFHQQNHVGAGGWGAGLRHCGIAVAGDKKKQPA